MTRGAAALVLGVDPATVGRMVDDGRLRRYEPVSAPTEKPALMLWGAEVTALAEARRVAREGVKT